MKEDLAIAKNNLLAFHEENCQLRQECGKDVGSYSMSASGVQITNISDTDSRNKVVGGEIDELRQRLDEERKLRQESDNELELQVIVQIEFTYYCSFTQPCYSLDRYSFTFYYTDVSQSRNGSSHEIVGERYS